MKRSLTNRVMNISVTFTLGITFLMLAVQFIPLEKNIGWAIGLFIVGATALFNAVRTSEKIR